MKAQEMSMIIMTKELILKIQEQEVAKINYHPEK